MDTRTSIVSTLEDLIRFQSTIDHPEERKRCADYIEEFFRGTPLHVRRFTHNNVPSVVVTKGDSKHPKVFLYGHFAVVPGTEEQFVPRRDGDKLIGRGALDMKGGLAVLMTLMKDLADTGHSVGLLAVGDEEVGGFNSTGYLIKEEGYRCDAVVMPDSGMTIHQIVTKEKGLVRVTFTASGVSAHGSRSWLGESAVDKLIETIQTMKTFFLPLAEHPDDHWVRTLNVGKIIAGNAFNQVPPEAVADCDIRFTETDDSADLLARMRSSLPAGVRMDIVGLSDGVFIDTAHPMMQSYQAAVRTIGREPVYISAHGRSDATFFTPLGIPVIQGQPDGESHHGPDEWVSVKALGEYYEVVRRFVEMAG